MAVALVAASLTFSAGDEASGNATGSRGHGTPSVTRTWRRVSRDAVPPSDVVPRWSGRAELMYPEVVLSSEKPLASALGAGQGQSLPAAVLWDMDGTLCDTEPWWIATEFALAERFGAEWTHEDALQMVGNDLLTSGEFLRRRWNLDLTPRQIVDLLHESVVERATHDEMVWRPGALDLLEALNHADVPCALVTMSWEVFAHPILERLPKGRFDAIITGDRVTRGKPFPDPYLAGAEALGVDPARCVAIEDSNTGAASAEAAGCTVLTVENHVPLNAGPRRVSRPTLAGLTPIHLGALMLGPEVTLA